MSAVLKFSEDRLPYDHVPTIVDIPFRDLSHELVRANNCSRLIGSGGYGRVYAIQSDQDKVFKVCMSHELKRDGYHNYLKIPYSYSGSNPFLPRVERFVKFQSTEDNVIVYGVIMELLYPLESAPIYVLKQMIKDLMVADSGYNNDPAYNLMLSIKQAYSRGTWSDFKNQDLIVALQQITLVQKEYSHCNDMSATNFMVRETLNWDTLHATYQLVITDPLS